LPIEFVHVFESVSLVL